MSLQKLAANFADYNYWVTKKFADWLSAKPHELLYKEVPSSFSSIIKTLNHIWGTEEYWYSIIAEIPEFENRRQTEVLDTKEIFNGGLKRAKLLSELIQSYSEEELSKLVKVINPWFQCELPKYDYLLQVINHGTYHRGQIVTIGRNIGITDGSISDYNFYNVFKDSPGK